MDTTTTITGTTATVGLVAAPPVRFEPCSAFHADPAPGDGVCAGCGWLADDHLAEADAYPAAA